MGLPSGKLWASANVGAAYPNDSGLYFSWGNTKGHAAGSGYDFSQENYDSTPGASINTDLSLEQDMARANLGAPWRLPSGSECQELYNNCNVEWTTMNGVAGALFKSRVNGNWLFFPAAGYYSGESLISAGVDGSVWASNWVSATVARRLEVTESNIRPQGSRNRRFGLTVRAICEPET